MLAGAGEALGVEGSGLAGVCDARAGGGGVGLGEVNGAGAGSEDAFGVVVSGFVAAGLVGET